VEGSKKKKSNKKKKKEKSSKRKDQKIKEVIQRKKPFISIIWFQTKQNK